MSDKIRRITKPIFTLIILSLISYFIIEIYFTSQFSVQTILILIFLAYFFILFFALYLYENHKFIKIIAFPLHIAPYFIDVIIYLALVYLSVKLFLLSLIFIFNLNISEYSQLYLKLTLSSILVTRYGQDMTSVLFDKNDRGYFYWEIAQKKILESSKKDVIKFYIFCLYFIALVLITVLKIDNKLVLYDYIFLQSFATYTAYDRVISNFENLKKQKENEEK